MRDGVEGLAGGFVERRRVVQVHVKGHVARRLPSWPRYNPGTGC